ncbi:trypsin-like serine protease [Dactylosporangium sp. NPDC048998]|uniref:trypsin-like serine protease n=1 Tax=Dactylosporangium sp. NPDC048998 TaxID=3363976 RepID=UPI00371372E9
MRTGRIAKTATVFTIASAAVLFGTPAMAEPSPDPTSTPTSNTPLVNDVDRARESLDYLMNKYGVTQDEAMRRLRLQERSPEIIKKVRDQVGDELLDFHIDQANGGKLVFLTSKPDAGAKALASVSTDAAEARFVQSKHTAKQLEAARLATEKKLAGKADVTVFADKRTETINVKYSGTNAQVAVEVRTLAGNVAGEAVQVNVDTSGPAPAGEQKACYLLSCDPPARGGIRMHVRRDGGDFGSCTVGYNVRGSNGWAYVLTAGHCVADTTRRQYTYHNGLPFTWEKAADGQDEHNANAPADTRYYSNAPSGNFYDWALLPYQTDGINWSGYWLRGQHNLVASSCTTSPSPCYSGNPYAILATQSWWDMSAGTIVCATGTGTGTVYSENVGYQYGTRCGEIASVFMLNYVGDGGGRGIKVNICSRKGDSGGPLFSQLQGKAYGILSGGPAGNGSCVANEYSVYASVEQVLSNAQTKTGLTFNVINTSNG